MRTNVKLYDTDEIKDYLKKLPKFHSPLTHFIEIIAALKGPFKLLTDTNKENVN